MGTRHQNRRLTRTVLTMAATLMFAESGAWAQNPRVISDPADDVVVRRTDPGNIGPIDPQAQGLPDLVEMQLGRFMPTVPHQDAFIGTWSVSGAYARFDIVFKGLVNPPGPVGWDDHSPSYDPFEYGPNPVFGYIEFDLDADENTGGELEYPQFRYLGHVGRFGGMPQGAEFVDRVAIDRGAFDHSVPSAPYCDRSGEEFHLVFRGEEIDDIHVKTEKPGGEESEFEWGERWILDGDFFHRAHGFEDYAFQCVDRPGRYKPEIKLQFQHDPLTDQTTVSLVYPLTNAASAALKSPSTPVQSNDGCEENQNSITEALTDLNFSAVNASPWDQNDPEFQLIAGWATKNPANYLDPALWRVTCLVGTAYATLQPGSARFAWTDIWPNVIPGDFNGDGAADAVDENMLDGYVAQVDGNSFYDEDLTADGVVTCSGFATSFMMFDVNYDGLVDGGDLSSAVAGDMDIDGDVDLDDIDDMVIALLDPAMYENTHGGVDPIPRGDLNLDGSLDGSDIELFVALLDAAPLISPIIPGDMNLDGETRCDDLNDFVLALLKPDVYTDTYGEDPMIRGDLNQDGNLDGLDIDGFLGVLLSP